MRVWLAGKRNWNKIENEIDSTKKVKSKLDECVAINPLDFSVHHLDVLFGRTVVVHVGQTADKEWLGSIVNDKDIVSIYYLRPATFNDQIDETKNHVASYIILLWIRENYDWMK